MSGDTIGWRDELGTQFVELYERWEAGRATDERGRQAARVRTRTLNVPAEGAQDLQDLTELTAVQLLDGYRKGEFSPVEATRAALERAERIQPEVNAFVRLTARRGPGAGPGVGRTVAARGAGRCWWTGCRSR